MRNFLNRLRLGKKFLNRLRNFLNRLIPGGQPIFSLLKIPVTGWANSSTGWYPSSPACHWLKNHQPVEKMAQPVCYICQPVPTDQIIHQPIQTISSLINHFPQLKKLLTPFRKIFNHSIERWHRVILHPKLVEVVGTNPSTSSHCSRRVIIHMRNVLNRLA